MVTTLTMTTVRDYPMAFFQRLGEAYPMGEYHKDKDGNITCFYLHVAEAQVSLYWYPKTD